MTSDWQAADRFVIDQLIRPMVNLYRISADGAPVAFVRQKRMAIKEDIRFFAHEDETEELFRIKARSLMEFGGRYDVTTPAGERIGVLGKVFGKSLLRSTSPLTSRSYVSRTPKRRFRSPTCRSPASIVKWNGIGMKSP